MSTFISPTWVGRFIYSFLNLYLWPEVGAMLIAIGLSQAYLRLEAASSGLMYCRVKKNQDSSKGGEIGVGRCHRHCRFHRLLCSYRTYKWPMICQHEAEMTHGRCWLCGQIGSSERHGTGGICFFWGSCGGASRSVHIRMVLHNKGELLLTTWLLYLLFLIIMGSKSGSGALLAILWHT